jgi:hypothetical protein
MKEAPKSETTVDYAEQVKKLERDMWRLSKDVELFAWISDEMFDSHFAYKSDDSNEKVALIGPTFLALISDRCRELSDRFEALKLERVIR